MGCNVGGQIPCPDCVEPFKPGKASGAQNLAYILDGEDVFGAKTWDYLKDLSSKTAPGFDVHDLNFPNYSEVGLALNKTDNSVPTVSTMLPLTSSVVGNSYRDGNQQSALRNKNPGNRVLIVPEPANPHDPCALAVVVARGFGGKSGFVWVHVGYVPRDQAKRLAAVWPKYRGRPLVGEGRLTGHPGRDKNPAIVVEGSFRNYFPD